jgi:hypothetical protein
MADYDLNAIADALAVATEELDTETYGGVATPLSTYSEVEGVVSAPALVFELDTVSYDLTAGRGADAAVFLGQLLVAEADSGTGQRLVRRVLSSGGEVDRIKDAIETDTTLGGLVSFVHFSGTRSIGRVTYNGIDYHGAVLVFEVVVQ